MATFTPASPASLAAFVAILGAVVVAFLVAGHRALGGSPRKTAALMAGTALYLGGFSAIVGSGWLPSLPLGGFPFVLAPALALSVAVGLSSLGRRLAETTPLWALVAFQGFRLPLELVLHSWGEQGTIPLTMTWSGQNLDVVSGVVALALSPLVPRAPGAARLANIVGFALLLNVMRVAGLSLPGPFGWGQTPPLLIGWHLPYALIVPVAVGGALIGHLVLMRALWSRAAAA